MDIISPVIEGLEGYEIILGGPNAGQPDETEIAALRSPEGIVLTRWAFTEEERKAIAAGEDLLVSVATFNHPFQPLKIEVGEKQRPEAVKRAMRLVDEYELRVLFQEVTGRQQNLQQEQIKLLKGDKNLNGLAKKLEEAKAKLERKKAEVFSEKPESKLVLAN